MFSNLISVASLSSFHLHVMQIQTCGTLCKVSFVYDSKPVLNFNTLMIVKYT